MQNETSQLLAQVPKKIGDICGTGLGLFGDCSKATNAGGNVSTIISLIIGFLTIVAGIFFLFQLIIGGYGWISASGDKQKLETAQNRITYGFIGLVIIVAAYGIASLMATVFGIDILNPTEALKALQK